jgi:hypothetical protein
MKNFIFIALLTALAGNITFADQMIKTITLHSIGKDNATPPHYDGNGDNSGPTYIVGNPSGSSYTFRLYSGLASSGDKFVQLTGADGYDVSQITISYGIDDSPSSLPNVIVNATTSEYTSNSDAWDNNASFTQLISKKGFSSEIFSSFQNTTAFNALKNWLDAGSKIYFGARSSAESSPANQSMGTLGVTVTYRKKFNVVVSLNQIIGVRNTIFVNPNNNEVLSGWVNLNSDTFSFYNGDQVTINAPATVNGSLNGNSTLFGLIGIMRDGQSLQSNPFTLSAPTTIVVNYRQSINGSFATKADYIHSQQNVMDEDISGSTIRMIEGATVLNDISTTTPATSLVPANASLKFVTIYGSYGQQNNYKSYSDVNIKHQNWNRDLGKYKLENPVSTSTDNIDVASRYKQLQSATVQVSMDGTVQSNTGVQFKDPWKVVADGQGAVTQPSNWDSYSVSFTPGNGNYASYGGLFNGVEYYSDQSGKAHYRAKTDLEKTIDGSNSAFLNWSGTNATIYSPTQTESPVKFDASGATVTANYKGNLRTSAPALGDSKNQRRLQLSGYKWIMVYESMGDVWLTSSEDAGATWGYEQRLSGGTGAASNPSLSNILTLSAGENSRDFFIITWLEDNMVHFQSMNSGQYGGGPYYGWLNTTSSQNSSNHVTNSITSWGLGARPQTTARPVVFLQFGGGYAYITYAFEGRSYDDATLGVITGKMTLYAEDNIYFPEDIEYASKVSAYHTVSSTTAAQQPVIMNDGNVFCLSGNSSSSLAITQYNYSTNTSTAVTIPTNTNYQSLQGALNGLNSHYTLVGESSCPPYNYPQIDIFKYGRETDFVLTMTTRWGGHQQPSVMIDQNSSYGNLNPCITGKQIFYPYWDKLEGSTQNTVANTGSGIYTRERVQSGDRAAMVTRTTQTSNPVKIQKYDGTTTLQKSSNQVLAKSQYREWTVAGNLCSTHIDNSLLNGVVVDSLQKGNTICALKLSGLNGEVLIQRKDSLVSPLGMDLLRKGAIVKSFAPSDWRSIAAKQLGDIQSGDIVLFKTKDVPQNLLAFEVLTPVEGALRKSGNGETDELVALKNGINVYPNPFNPSTTFRVSLPEAKHVQLAVYNMIGQKVATVVDGTMQAGYNEVRFDGSSLASGMYVYRMQIEREITSGKILLTK